MNILYTAEATAWGGRERVRDHGARRPRDERRGWVQHRGRARSRASGHRTRRGRRTRRESASGVSVLERAPRQRRRHPDRRMTTLVADRVWDGLASRPAERGFVRVEDGLIEATG